MRTVRDSLFSLSLVEAITLGTAAGLVPGILLAAVVFGTGIGT
jgi:hypothetical protein